MPNLRRVPNECIGAHLQAPCVRAPSQSLCEKPLQALFNYELDSKAELLLSRAREQVSASFVG